MQPQWQFSDESGEGFLRETHITGTHVRMPVVNNIIANLPEWYRYILREFPLGSSPCDEELEFALILILDAVEQAVVSNNFIIINSWLMASGLVSLHPTLQSGFLRFSARFRTQINQWDDSVARVYEVFVQNGIDANGLLRGLR